MQGTYFHRTAYYTLRLPSIIGQEASSASGSVWLEVEHHSTADTRQGAKAVQREVSECD
jgi:hypothetical protein